VFSSFLILASDGNFYRAITSVLEADGKTIALGTEFTDATVIALLKAGKSYVGEVELADGKEHDGFYVPLMNGKTVWGAVGAAEKAVAK